MPAAASTTRNAAGAKRLPSRRSRSSELYDGLAKLHPELMGRALRMARETDVAQDLVQDTVERALRFQHHYQPGTNLRAWANQILLSVFVTRCRRSRCERNAVGVLTTDPCAWTSPDQRPEMERLSPPVQRALDGLPRCFRRVVVLVDLEEVSYKTAAKRLKVPVGTVMSRLHRGRKMLADELRSGRALRLAA